MPVAVANLEYFIKIISIQSLSFTSIDETHFQFGNPNQFVSYQYA